MENLDLRIENEERGGLIDVFFHSPFSILNSQFLRHTPPWHGTSRKRLRAIHR
jgi:hypothetical protein